MLLRATDHGKLWRAITQSDIKKQDIDGKTKTNRHHKGSNVTERNIRQEVVESYVHTHPTGTLHIIEEAAAYNWQNTDKDGRKG